MNRRAGRTARGIHYEVHDNPGKPTLVLIMGYAGGLASWGERFLARLAPHFAYVVLDNRGTGRSIKPERDDEYSIELMALDTEEVIQSVTSTPVGIVGYSMGGCVAQEIALRGKVPLASLTLIASTAGGQDYRSPGEGVLKALAEPKGEKLLDFFEATWHVCMGVETTRRHWDELVEIFDEQAKHLTPRVAMRGHLKAYTRFASGPRLGQLKVPTVVIAGDEDPLTPPENSRILARLVPGARLELLPGIKHNPQTECPARLVALLGAPSTT